VSGGGRLKKRIRLEVNGEEYELDVDVHRTLLEVLRENLELTGTKKGCNTGNCGACTVLMDSSPVASCMLLAIEADGKQILTIEGLARNGNLHPLQRAFINQGAIQCGFCTPGMILSAKSLLDRQPKPNEEQVREALAGNLCRCTGYAKIIDAVLAVAEE
jgi:carbon-monoxide dehydrogenase small subunit